MPTTRARFARGEFTLRAGGVALRGRQQGESAGRAQRGGNVAGGRSVEVRGRCPRIGSSCSARGVKEVAGDAAGNVG